MLGTGLDEQVQKLHRAPPADQRLTAAPVREQLRRTPDRRDQPWSQPLPRQRAAIVRRERTPARLCDPVRVHTRVRPQQPPRSPVQAPVKFETVVNLKTVRALGFEGTTV